MSPGGGQRRRMAASTTARVSRVSRTVPSRHNAGPFSGPLAPLDTFRESPAKGVGRTSLRAIIVVLGSICTSQCGAYPLATEYMWTRQEAAVGRRSPLRVQMTIGPAKRARSVVILSSYHWPRNARSAALLSSGMRGSSKRRVRPALPQQACAPFVRRSARSCRRPTACDPGLRNRAVGHAEAGQMLHFPEP
jgi:hypothetical protein